MALEQGTDPIAVSLTAVDNNNNSAQFGFYTPNALTIAQVVARAQAVKAAAQAVSNASFIGGSITIPLIETAPTAAVPESEIERKLILIGRTASKRQKPRFELPSPLFSIEQANTDEVSLANALVLALVNELGTGALGPGNAAVAVSGIDILGFTRAYISHRYREPKG